LRVPGRREAPPEGRLREAIQKLSTARVWIASVNTIAPGRIDTAQIRKLHPTEQSRADFIRQNIPAGYFGEPHDIGHLTAFLASPLARYINGAAIPVDGGAVRRAL